MRTQTLPPEPPAEPISVAAADAAMADFIETHGYVTETGDPVEFDTMPTGVGEHDDDDEEV
jgi:acyl transferase domain-containing protein